MPFAIGLLAAAGCAARARGWRASAPAYALLEALVVEYSLVQLPRACHPTRSWSAGSVAPSRRLLGCRAQKGPPRRRDQPARPDGVELIEVRN
jgi:hypothetical protein